MRFTSLHQRGLIGTAIAAAITLGIAAGAPAPAGAAPAARPQTGETVTLSVGRGQLIKLKGTMTDLFVAKPEVADVQVKSNTQLYLFGKAAGETTVYATDKSGAVVWSATVRVGQNLNSVGQMLKLAMPDADITATPMNGLVLLTGTVGTPADIEEAQRLTTAFVGEGTQVVSRLKTAVPLQVNLQVRIAEVSRDLTKAIGMNLASADLTNGFKFGIGQGRPFGPQYTPGGPLGTGVTSGATGTTVVTAAQRGTTLAFAGRLLGLDLLGTLDLAENQGLVTTLANPNLTALSGETASFLAGGEIPIPISQGLGSVSVDYKQYGVSLAFTPTVLTDGRISMRVRPEVSQLTQAGSVTINGFTVPGISTRRAETTVELGSGQSFMIGGLLSNSQNNTIDKAPFLGDLPVLGALFRSNSWRHQQTELVIVVTPYLVKPVNGAQVALPTDGYRGATDAQRIIGGQLYDGRSGEKRPIPQPTPSVTVPVAPNANPAPGPGLGDAAPVVPARSANAAQAVAPASAPQPLPAPAPARPAPSPAGAVTAQRSAVPAPGFSFN